MFTTQFVECGTGFTFEEDENTGYGKMYVYNGYTTIEICDYAHMLHGTYCFDSAEGTQYFTDPREMARSAYIAKRQGLL